MRSPVYNHVVSSWVCRDPNRSFNWHRFFFCGKAPKWSRLSGSALASQRALINTGNAFSAALCRGVRPCWPWKFTVAPARGCLVSVTSAAIVSFLVMQHNRNLALADRLNQFQKNLMICIPSLGFRATYLIFFKNRHSQTTFIFYCSSIKS